MGKWWVIGCLFSLLSFFTVSTSYAQIFVTNSPPYNSEVYLVQDVFLGTGVTVGNITYYGDTNYLQIGLFNGQNSSIGLDSGIVMTSGDIAEIVPGVNTGNGQITNIPGVYPNGQGGGDADLLTVANLVPTQLGLGFTVSQTRDASILEFDFSPSADTVEFRYVFATDEFPNFINTQYNDVFGFFLSGPGITGPYSSPPAFPGGATNIALVPGTTLPITVSTVHPNLNSQYFVAQDTSISFNGGTVVLTAKHAVTACDTYHIKLAIADGVDKLLNSGVFLEAKSFSSGAIQIDAVPEYTTLGGSDTNLYEGCGFVEITFRRFADLANGYTAYFNVGGTATMGTDYSTFADSVVFPPGQDTVIVQINVTDDGIPEGPETIIITMVPDTVSCWMQNLIDTSQIVMVIDERPLVTMTTIDDTVNCADSFAVVMAQGLSGVEDFVYLWPSGDTISTDTIPNPQGDTALFVMMTDACGVDTISDSAYIRLFNPPLNIATVNDSMDCQTDSVFIGPQILSGSSVQFYTWSTGSSDSAIWVNPTADSTYYVTVTDSCVADVGMDSITVFQFSPPLTTQDVNDTANCLTNFVQLSPNITGGTAPYTYLWNTGQFTPSINLFNPTDTTFTVLVNDACDPTPDTVTESLTVFSPPLTLQNVSDTIDCNEDSILIGPLIGAGTAPYVYQWSSGQTDSAIFVSPTADTSYTITVTDQCDPNPDSAVINVVVNVPSPMTLNLTNTTVNCPGDTSTITAQVTGGTVPYAYTWGGGETSASINVPITNDTTFAVQVIDACNTDTVQSTITVNVPVVTPLSMIPYATSLNCPGDSTVIMPNVTGGSTNSPLTYVWTWFAGTTTTEDLNTGPVAITTVYTLLVTDFCGNTDTGTFDVLVPTADSALSVTLPDSVSLCDGQELTLMANVGGGFTPLVLNWDGPTGFLSSDNPLLSTTPVPGDYVVEVTDNCGLVVRDTSTLEILLCDLVVPNVMSPNGDGINDYFIVPNLEKFPNSALTVFNRWGTKIFYNEDYRNNFDGRFLTDGNYFWVLELSNGETLKGTLMILHD